MTDAELADLERLCEAATPGPWKAETGAHQCIDEEYDLWYARSPLVKVVGFEAGKATAGKDADFISAARTALPALIAELRLARTIRVCLNCELVGRHVESCNACGGTEFEELMP